MRVIDSGGTKLRLVPTAGSVRQEVNGASDEQLRAESGRPKDKHAFMACLWAPDERDPKKRDEKLQRYITDAMVLGYSLSLKCLKP